MHTPKSRRTYALELELTILSKVASADQMRGLDQAAERAIKAVAELQRPLRMADDCEALGIGEKSAEKLREIVSTGRLRRNQVRAPPVDMLLRLICGLPCVHMHL